MLRLILSALFFFPLFLFSQNIDLTGKWFKKQDVPCLSSFEDLEVFSSNEIWNFFAPEQLRIVIAGSGSSTHADFKYQLKGNEIESTFWKYEIDVKSDEEMILIANPSSGCRKMRFVSESVMFDEQAEKYTVSSGDTLYLPLPSMGPVLEKVAGIEDYFRTEMLKKFKTSNIDCKIRYHFSISKTGEIANLKLNTCNSKTEKYLSKLIEKTEGKWTPMYLHDLPVNAFIQGKFRIKPATIIRLN